MKKLMMTAAAAVAAVSMATAADKTAADLVAEGKYVEALREFAAKNCTNLVTEANVEAFYDAAFATTNYTMVNYLYATAKLVPNAKFFADSLNAKYYDWALYSWDNQCSLFGETNNVWRWQFVNAVIDDDAASSYAQYLAFLMCYRTDPDWRKPFLNESRVAATRKAMQKGKYTIAANIAASKEFMNVVDLPRANAVAATPEQKQFAMQVINAVIANKDQFFMSNDNSKVNIDSYLKTIYTLAAYEAWTLGDANTPRAVAAITPVLGLYSSSTHSGQYLTDSKGKILPISYMMYEAWLKNSTNFSKPAYVNTAKTFANNLNRKNKDKSGTALLYSTLEKLDYVSFQLEAALELNDTDKVIDTLMKNNTQFTAAEIEKTLPILNSLDVDYRAADVRRVLRNINARYTIKLYDDRATWEPIISKIRAMIDVR